MANELVYQTWQRVTGKPWTEASKGGFTDGSAATNLALQKKLNAGWNPYAQNTPANSPAAAADPNAYINQNQQADFNAAVNANAPTLKTNVASITESFPDILKTITGGQVPPTPPSLSELYTKLTSEGGVTELEQQLNDLTNQEQTIMGMSEARQLNAEGGAVSLGVIGGRQGEIERQTQQQLQTLGRIKSYVADQLKTKYTMISTIMDLTKSDYQLTKDAYDTKFNQAIQVINTLQTAQRDADTQAQRQQDNARANLQIIANSVTDGTSKFSDLSPESKAMVSKLEAQAGLPIGFTSTLKSKVPDAEIVSTTIRYQNGNQKYADVLTRDRFTGEMKVVSQFLGTEVDPKVYSEQQANYRAQLSANAARDNKAASEAAGIKDAFYKDLQDPSIKIARNKQEEQNFAANGVQYTNREDAFKRLVIKYPNIPISQIAQEFGSLYSQPGENYKPQY